jgi:hypothetical protein
MHLPPVHVSPEGHVTPHPPQSWGLVVVSTHTPLHSVSPAVEHVHLPLTQVALEPQATPHPPQLFGSVCSLTQAFPQFVVPPVQLRTHFPLEQTTSAPPSEEHALPQLPQFVGLELTSTHCSLQNIGVVPCVQAHPLETHV